MPVVRCPQQHDFRLLLKHRAAASKEFVFTEMTAIVFARPSADFLETMPASPAQSVPQSALYIITIY